MTAATESSTLGMAESTARNKQRKQTQPAAAVNFSRPRTYKTSSGKTYTEGDSNVKSVNAYYEVEDEKGGLDEVVEEEEEEEEEEQDNGSIHHDRNTGEPMPSEPRFSLDDESLEESSEKEVLEEYIITATTPPPQTREPRHLPPSSTTTTQRLPPDSRFSVETFDLDPSNNTTKSSLISRTEAFLRRKGSTFLRAEDQRHPGPGPAIAPRNNSTSNDSSNTDNNTNTRTPATKSSKETLFSSYSFPSSSSPIPPTTTIPIKSILKQTSVEVHSERALSSDGEDGEDNEPGEDTSSHHTISEMGDHPTTTKTTTTTAGHQRRPLNTKNSSISIAPTPTTSATTTAEGYYDRAGKWHASDFSTSNLTEKELKRCVRKGANPSLYAEMKAARGGRPGFGGLAVGALTGNTYVS